MEPLLVERKEHVLIVTINRPERLNALDLSMHDRLDKVWTDYDSDAELRCAIFTGTGEKAFCAGSDLKNYAATEQIQLPANGYGGIARRRLRKPLIAAVNGLALGGGFEFALCCDIILAAEHATFGLPEVRLGGAAMGGGIPRLVRRIPYSIAMDLLLTTRRMGAAEAHRIGLVNEVVPREKLMETAMRWAGEIVLGSPLGAILTKEIAEATLRGDEDFLSLVGELGDARQRPIMESEDWQEALRAFAERRPPVWKGR